jgi:hypothetical protein
LEKGASQREAFLEALALNRDFFPKLTYHETDGKEWAALEDSCRHVAAVVALGRDTLVALDIAAKCVFAAEKEEEHVGFFFFFGSGLSRVV